MAAKPPKASRVDAEITPCQLLTRQGDPCGKPGQVGLPAGICVEHAIAVFRSVSKLVAVQAAEEVSRG